MKKQNLFFIVWLLAFSFIVWRIFFREKGFKIYEKIIATVNKSRDAEILNSGRLDWEELERDQKVGLGNFIKTGNQGETKVKLKDNRTLVLGPNTFIKFNERQSANDDIWLSLYEGEVAVTGGSKTGLNRKNSSGKIRIGLNNELKGTFPCSKVWKIKLLIHF